MYPILLIKLVDKVSVYQPESSNDSYGELNDLGDATWKCHVIIFILIEHMEKNPVQNITSMSVILVQKIVQFLILWNIGKNFVENFKNKTASVPLHKSINTHQFLHYIHAEQRMTFEKSSEINYIWQLWGLYVMDVNCKSCCFC